MYGESVRGVGGVACAVVVVCGSWDPLVLLGPVLQGPWVCFDDLGKCGRNGTDSILELYSLYRIRLGSSAARLPRVIDIVNWLCNLHILVSLGIPNLHIMPHHWTLHETMISRIVRERVLRGRRLHFSFR